MLLLFSASSLTQVLRLSVSLSSQWSWKSSLLRQRWWYRQCACLPNLRVPLRQPSSSHLFLQISNHCCCHSHSCCQCCHCWYHRQRWWYRGACLPNLRVPLRQPSPSRFLWESSACRLCLPSPCNGSGGGISLAKRLEWEVWKIQQKRLTSAILQGSSALKMLKNNKS